MKEKSRRDMPRVTSWYNIVISELWYIVYTILFFLSFDYTTLFSRETNNDNKSTHYGGVSITIYYVLIFIFLYFIFMVIIYLKCVCVI